MACKRSPLAMHLGLVFAYHYASMRDEAIERLYDVLQNIEFAILDVYEKDVDLLDLDVVDALDALVRRYVAEEGARTPPRLRLSERAIRVFEAAGGVCEWRLGRASLNGDDPDSMIPPDRRISIADILMSLKRIRKSVHTWNEEAGRQGYLSYISHFFSQIERRKAGQRQFSA